jgi:peptidoglycan hydrolase-like protein with peptidoglycan-binding domain
MMLQFRVLRVLFQRRGPEEYAEQGGTAPRPQRCCQMLKLLPLVFAFAALPAVGLEARQQPESVTMTSVNEAEWQEEAERSPALLVKLQILLDRAHASPGVIDGTPGENTRKAIAAFAEMKGLEPTEQVNEQLWRALVETGSEPALTTYKITEKDVRGPFSKKIPEDFRNKAAMDRLGYTSPQELLGEKFHMSEALLRKLNPEASFEKAGQEIVIANVEQKSLPGKISRVEVDAKQQRLKAYGAGDALLAIYPATVGSEDRPSPKGEFKVTKVSENPVYEYNPALQLRGVKVKEKLKLPPGPNNPVGAVWIDLSAEGYGIHGTPDPEEVSKAASHGCIRLTNWDALALARSLNKGTPVEIHDGQKSGALQAPNGALSQTFADAAPLPQRNPARSGLSEEQKPAPPGEVATIPWTDTDIAAAKAKCTESLSSLPLDYEPLPPIKEGLCGAPAPILLKSVGSKPKVVIDPPATVTCTLAKALSTWLTEAVQPEANTLFGSSVSKLHAGSYTCRNRNAAPHQRLSEHALANAIDISDFVLVSGQHIAVADSSPNDDPPLPVAKPGRDSGETLTVQLASARGNGHKREFLKSVRHEACAVFGTVLGPGADDAHESHLHLDMKQRRGASFCQ